MSIKEPLPASSLLTLENRIIKFFFFSGLSQTIVAALLIVTILAPQQIASKKQDLAYLAETSAYVISGDIHHKLWSEQLGEDSEIYQDIKLSLQNLSSYWSEIDSIYTMVKTDDPTKLQFVVDSVTSKDRNQDGHIAENEQAAAFGEIYDISQDPKMLEGFERVTVDFTPVTDKWGNFVSAYAPIKDSHNQVVAMVGVDLLSDHYYSLIKQVVIDVTKVLMGLQVLNLLLSVYLSKAILNPFNDRIKV